MPADVPFPLASLVIVAAHPDDEVIGAGAQLAQVQDITIIHVTDGAPCNLADAQGAGFRDRAEYAAARRRELLDALAIAGIPAERASQIGIVDQEASLYMPELSWRLQTMLEAIRPHAVLTHPYEGGHPDHDATAFAVHAAAQPRAIPVFEFASYHNRDGAIATGCFLPASTPAYRYVLSPGERELKRRMLDRFVSQQQVIEWFPLEYELFRPAPDYDFTRPPHEGTLLYERFGWGWTGERWRTLAAQANAALELEVYQ